MQLIHGDCLENMKDIPDKSIDMILCDLPYGTTACKWDVVIPFEPLWEQYKRAIKDRGAIVLFGSQPFSSALVMSNPEWFKYEFSYLKVNKSGNLNAKNRPMSAHENVLVFYNKQPFYNNIKENSSVRFGKPATVSKTENYKSCQNKNYVRPDYVCKDSVLSGFPVDSRGLHPTQKPVALLEYLIKTYTLEGETILDNCMGSGSTGVACINTNRNFIGIEKDDKYFEIAKNRINNHLTSVGADDQEDRSTTGR